MEGMRNAPLEFHRFFPQVKNPPPSPGPHLLPFPPLSFQYFLIDINFGPTLKIKIKILLETNMSIFFLYNIVCLKNENEHHLLLTILVL